MFEEKLKSLKINDKIAIFLFILSIIFLMICISKINFSLNVDETFSLSITKFFSYKDVTYLTAIDVHPPLYYYLLKSFIVFFSVFNVNPMLSGQIFSIIPTILLLVVSATKIRKNMGLMTAGIFALCVTSMPNFMHYTVNIRMYMWACFFTTMAYIYAYEVINNSNLKNWSILTFFTICASYTHYYGILSTFSIYLVILIYMIFKSKSEVKKCIISYIIFIISYIPWIMVLFDQINTYKGNYWITEFTYEKIIALIKFLFSSNTISSEIIGYLFLVSTVLLLYLFSKRKKDMCDWFALSGFKIFILTIIFAFLVSSFIMPIFNERYMFVTFGCFLLAFSIMLAKIQNKRRFFVPILLILICVSSINTLYYVNVSDEDIRNYDVYASVNCNPDDIIICDDVLTAVTFDRWYHPDCTIYCYNLDEIDFGEVIDNATANNHSVWLFYNGKVFDDENDDMLDAFSNNYTLTNKAQLSNITYANFPVVIYQIN